MERRPCRTWYNFATMHGQKRTSLLTIALIGGLILTTAAAGYFGYRSWKLETNATRSAQTLSERSAEVAAQNEEITRLTEALASLRDERDSLAADLEAEENKNEVFEDQIREITGTVGKLDKLSQTDPELLKKYSKVYFLNEHYAPKKVERLEDTYAYDESREFYLDSEVVPFFEDMVDDAKDDGVDLWVVSAFRSFDEQTVLKGRYTVTYGSGANAFSADQGYSEHQLGTTVDFTTTGLGGGLTGFHTTPAYAWLVENAHKYGFVLSYPEGNSYYVYEPWHWRFVGTELARDLHDDNKYFYDLDQRTLDEYLISIFD